MESPILSAQTLRAVEARHASAEPPLMERAGAAAARIATAMLAGKSGPVLVLAGPGNNGGDAFVAARLLRAAGHHVTLCFVDDAARLPVDAAKAHAAWLAAGGVCTGEFPDGHLALIIDGLFGIGLSRAVVGPHADWIEKANASASPILALDTPSGLNAKTGHLTGPTIRATRTATFIALKPGLLTGDGPDHCGRIDVCDLDLSNALTRLSDGLPIHPALFRASLEPRARNSHKGSYGNVAIVGGAPGMAGAALLAGRAALKLGTGRVYVGMIERLPVDPLQPELMLRAPEEAIAAATVIAVGPGLGQSAAAHALVGASLASELPLVIDADGLNLLAGDAALTQRVAVRPAPTFLTPHPTEAARLLGSTTATVQADRRRAALELARRTGAHVALKGCGTIVATPDGCWFINTNGNPGLASAGSGDVLTGMLAALLAQGWQPLAALLGAVHLHGAAADACVAAGQGPIGLTAGELIEPARRLLNTWTAAFGTPPGAQVQAAAS
jgi:hydroxyethylthiazole kinase-like uncharacterized protein yjeF